MVTVWWCLALAVGPVAGEELPQAIAAVRAVGPNGQGAAQAAAAWRTLARADAACLPELLAGMTGANPLARNWLRAAADAVREQAQAQGQPLPVPALETFLRQTQHDPQARRFVYDLLAAADPTVPERFLPGMLDDPSPDLRRDAVARVLEQADQRAAQGQADQALPLYRQAFQAAREQTQIVRVVRKLRELGDQVDLATHLGLVLDWHLIGPFPNEKMQGMAQAYPPEQAIDLNAEYDGKAGKVRWTPFHSPDEMGRIDFHKGIGPHEEAVAYATTVFTLDQDRTVEIRLASFSAFQLWVNGELVLVRGDAYTGTRLDHYRATVPLRAGKNVLLLKFAQDAIPAQLPKQWFFQLRVCDPTGVAIRSTTRPPAPKQP